MAYTRIHSVKTTVHKTIDYICNEDKTDGKLLVSAFGTSAETAKHDFKYALSKTNEYHENKAYHLIQSFAPGEVTPEKAHAIGRELADKMLGGKYSYVIATHIDKNHVHNHICFCAVDNIEHKKYHACTKGYYQIRELSDQICKENNLSVIQSGPGKTQKYNEWQANKNGTSWKTQLRNDIDDAILKSKNYDDFIPLMKAKGYEIKEGKYIAFKPIGCGNFIRGRDSSLGSEYTKERIAERIQYKSSVSMKPAKLVTYDISSSKLNDTNEDKFKNSPVLSNWADIQNLKIAASAYSKAPNINDLKSQYEKKSAIADETYSTIVSLEKQIRDLAEVITYAEQYIDNEPYHHRYMKSKDQDRYYRTHDTQLVLFDGAKTMLERFGINTAHIDLEFLHSEYDTLVSKKNEFNVEYKNVHKDAEKLRKQIENIEKYTGINKNPKIIKSRRTHEESL